jgi:tetratricopeptide (TPR) repeat protein
MLALALILLLQVAARQQTAASQMPATVIQRTSGWCSPAIANIAGNVTVNCIGVDPRALIRLNRELGKKNLQLADNMREANEWAARYKELEARLDEVHDDASLSRQAEEYLHEGELEKAGLILDQILKAEEKQVDHTAANHYNRALAFELQFCVNDALPHLEKAYRYRPGVLKYGLEYASVSLHQHDFRTAEPVLLATLDNARMQAKTNLEAMPDLAWTLNDLGTLYLNTQRPTEAEAAFKESTDIRRQLAVEGSSAAQADLAGSLVWQAFLYEVAGQKKESEADYQEALVILRRLAKVGPVYESYLATTLGGLGTFYFIQTQQMSQAEAALQEALSLFRELAVINPGAYQECVAGALNILAVLYTRTQRMKEAEAALQQALDIFRQLAKTDSARYSYSVACTLSLLGALYSQTQHLKESQASLLEAIEIVRPLAKQEPAYYEPIFAATLGGLAMAYYQNKQVGEAEMASEEAIIVLHSVRMRGLVGLNRTNFDRMYTVIAFMLGETYRDTDRLNKAETAYQNALDGCRDLSDVDHTAFEFCFANILTNSALLHNMTGELRRAIRESDDAIGIYRDKWKANPSATTASNLTLSLMAAALAAQDSLEACRLTRQAATVANNLTSGIPLKLMERAQKLMTCTNQ